MSKGGKAGDNGSVNEEAFAAVALAGMRTESEQRGRGCQQGRAEGEPPCQKSKGFVPSLSAPELQRKNAARHPSV